jgi:hypothetical protein
MRGDELPEFGALSPETVGGSTGLHIYVNDVDFAFDRALKAGTQVEMPVMDQFWGDRYGKRKDAFGHKWSIATHVKDLSMDEMKHGMDVAMAKMQKTASIPQPARESLPGWESCSCTMLVTPSPARDLLFPASFAAGLLSASASMPTESSSPAGYFRSARFRSYRPGL